MDVTALKRIQESIHRSAHAVDIIAVTKTHPYSCIKDSYEAGLFHIGENRVEDAIPKINLARQDKLSDICWHMIGHVQSRKIRDVVTYFQRVDSVDSMELLRKLDEEAQKQNKHIRVLLEINISAEEGKYGFASVSASMLQNLKTSHVVIDGLMTMAPFVHTPQENKTVFQALKRLSDDLRNHGAFIGTALSMGTSCDYPVAIEEGATEIRLGEALFGKRGIA